MQDNFLSNWASGLTRSLECARAEISANGGLAEFEGLYEGGRRVKAKHVSTKFGSAWVLDESEADLIEKRGKVFLPFGRKSRILRDLGLIQKPETAPAWAVLDGEGRGTGGAHSVRVVIFRTGCKWGSDANEVQS
tara:strand:+ start:1048 stop:1452 length:405 start_codon:yes stop_codon:yes gene_type:complete